MATVMLLYPIHAYSPPPRQISGGRWYCIGVVRPSVTRYLSGRSGVIVILQEDVLAYEDGSH